MRKASVDIEKIGQLDINWLTIEDSKQVGAVGTRVLPSYFVKIWSTIQFANSQINVILLDSKKTSVEFEKLLYERNDLAYEERVTSERSRYSIFCKNATSPYFVLMNKSALNERSAIFLTILNIRFSNKWTLLREVADWKQEEIIKILSKAVFAFNRKMGFPFVSADEGMRTFFINSIINIQHSFCECEAIQELGEEKALTPDLADYLQYKLETTFSSLDYSARFIIYEALQTLERIILDNFLILATRKNAPLLQFLSNCFNERFNVFKREYSEFPDLVKALENAVDTLQRFSLLTFEEFATTAASVISTSISQLEPVYISLAEVVALVQMSDYYVEGLENNVLVEVPDLGSIHQYVKLLRKIFAKEGIYPEIRIMAGYALEHTLMSWLMINGQGNIQLFEDYSKGTKELASLIELNLPEILRKNPDFGYFKGSPLRYEDAANKLLTLSKIARTFGDKEVEKDSLDLAEKIIDKYGLTSLKFSIYWTRFVETQNFVYIEKIHLLIRDSDKSELAKHNFLVIPLNLLIEAILYGGNVDQNIDEAENSLIESTSIGSTTQTFAKTGLNTTERFYHIFEMIREFLKYQGNLESIKKAYKEALIVGEILESRDPLQILSLKTRIIYSLLSNDLASAALLIQKLSEYPDTEKCIATFLSFCNLWINISSSNERRTFMHRDKFHYEGRDFWILILQRFVFQVMANDFGSNIAGSRAVVFVEGITDICVLKEFLRKIEPQEPLYFMELEGYSNFNYYVEPRFATQMRIPTYIIFDGDTLEDKKRKTIKSVSTPASHSYTLKKKRIEDYLLNVRAIVKAFPERSLSEKAIENFFAETNEKKNKKTVLQLVFSRFEIGKYDQHSAGKIASSFEVEEFDPELRVLLVNLLNLRNV